MWFAKKQRMHLENMFTLLHRIYFSSLVFGLLTSRSKSSRSGSRALCESSYYSIAFYQAGQCRGALFKSRRGFPPSVEVSEESPSKQTMAVYFQIHTSSLRIILQLILRYISQ
jgi:hypothetical protein